MSDLPEKIRAFVAISVDSEVLRAVEDLVAQLRSQLGSDDDGIRWVASANLHLTLKFLGPAVALENIRRLQPELEAIANDTAAFELEVAGVGGFPDLRHPKVLWIGLRSDALKELAARIEDAAERCGFERERRAFNPHLTIGRLRRPRLKAETRRRLEEAKNHHFGNSTIREMTLYRSITGPTGSTYEALTEFAFRRQP